MIINEFSNLADSTDNIKRYEPICLAKETKKNEFRLFNLNASSLTSNETNITTNENVYIFDADKKSFKYQGNTYILNCEMSSIDVNYATQVMQWYNNDTTIRVIDGKEYISSDSSHVIRFFKISRPNARADTPLEPDSPDFNWNSSVQNHTPPWFPLFVIGTVLSIPLFFYFTRYVNTRMAGRSILRDLRRDLRLFNDKDKYKNPDVLEILENQLDEGTYNFTKTFPQNLRYRNKDDLANLETALRDLKSKKMEEYLTFFQQEDSKGKTQRKYGDLIQKFSEDSLLYGEYSGQGRLRSNIEILGEAMNGAYYNHEISQKIKELREGQISKESVDDILDRFTYGTTDVASWGKKTLDLLEGLKKPEIHIKAPDGYEILEQGEQKLETDIEEGKQTVQENLRKEQGLKRKEDLKTRTMNRQLPSYLLEEEHTLTDEEKEQEKNNIREFFSNAYNSLESFFKKKGEDVSGEVEGDVRQSLLEDVGDI